MELLWQVLVPETELALKWKRPDIGVSIALHGLEEDLLKAHPKGNKPAVIRFADDVVVLHHELDQLYQVKEQAETWL